MNEERKQAPTLTMQTDRHRMLHRVPGLGLVMDVHNRNELCFASLVTTESSIFLVREGAMRVEAPGANRITARRGEFLLLQSGVPVKVTHIPAASGLHEASGLLWDRKMIAAAAPTDEACFRLPFLLLGERGEEFRSSFASACRSLREGGNLPPSIAAHRMREMLQWLSLESLYFRPAENHTLSSRLRDLLITAPGDNWPEKKAAHALGRSQATLRRHLAAEASSFREILAETRMLHALRLLHSTDASIGNIARDSGYACQSRFTQRFRERFGFPPSAVRGHRRT